MRGKYAHQDDNDYEDIHLVDKLVIKMSPFESKEAYEMTGGHWKKGINSIQKLKHLEMFGKGKTYLYPFLQNKETSGYSFDLRQWYCKDASWICPQAQGWCVKEKIVTDLDCPTQPDYSRRPYTSSFLKTILGITQEGIRRTPLYKINTIVNTTTLNMFYSQLTFCITHVSEWNSGSGTPLWNTSCNQRRIGNLVSNHSV